MFDIFKKLDEDQNNGELNTIEPSETVEENIHEETPSEELTTQEPCQNQKENILSTLQLLEEEERTLLLERSQLANMEKTLAQRAKEKAKTKRHRIENLRHEIPELKQRCEALARALDMPVQK